MGCLGMMMLLSYEGTILGKSLTASRVLLLRLMMLFVMMVWSLDQMKYATQFGSWQMNKACAPDQKSDEHLKYASYRLSVLLALCFSGLLAHGILNRLFVICTICASY